MRIEYDREADALYIMFREVKPTGNVDIEAGITADFDEKKQLVGIEVLNASRRLPADALTTVTVRNLLAA